MNNPEIRWKVGCINWSHPDAPHALAYASVNGAMKGERFFPTWAEAYAYADTRARGGAR